MKTPRLAALVSRSLLVSLPVLLACTSAHAQSVSTEPTLAAAPAKTGTKYEGGAVDGHLALDVAIPLGPHAFVLRGVVNSNLTASGLVAKDASGQPRTSIDARREPSMHLVVGPEFRL